MGDGSPVPHVTEIGKEKRKMAIKEDRFLKTVVDGGGMSDNYMAIYVDRKTGVNYLFSQSGYAGGMCVLVDRDGKPIVTPVPNNYEE